MPERKECLGKCFVCGPRLCLKDEQAVRLLCVCVCDVGAESSEKTRRELEVKVSRLQQQVDSVTQQSIHSQHELKLAVQREKLAHDSDVDRLSADKVLVTVVVVIVTLLTRCLSCWWS